jgi:hypothetical protein
MNIRRLAVVTSTCAVLAGAALAASGPASASAPTNGCPRSFFLWSVAEHLPMGYHLPVVIDDPTSGVRSFGQPGNGDGYVCAHLLGKTENGQPLYEFFDNTLPASSSR